MSTLQQNRQTISFLKMYSNDHEDALGLDAVWVIALRQGNGALLNGPAEENVGQRLVRVLLLELDAGGLVFLLAANDGAVALNEDAHVLSSTNCSEFEKEVLRMVKVCLPWTFAQ